MAKAAPKKFILLLCMVGVLLAGAALAPSLAWYRPVKADFGPANVNGAVRASYFQSGNGKSAGQIVNCYDENEKPVFNNGYTESDYNGTGSQDAAYEIKTPEQFYNLAWLQYLGYFNKVYNEDGVEQEVVALPTTYFYLSADLDMTGKILPPIGTREYPFIGSFDGCGHTVKNLTVANTANSVELAVNEEDFTETEIVGVFGVVGSLDAPVEPTNEKASVTSGEKTYTYSSKTNKIKNVTFSQVTIRTETDNALVGLAAGYVNGTLENVGVADSTLSIKAGTAALDKMTAITTDDLSDYSLVGYCTQPYLGGGKTVTTKHFTPEEGKTDSGIFQPGAGNSWGGSVDMKALYERLSRFAKASTPAEIQTALGTSTKFYNNFSGEEKGSVCFSKYDENTIISSFDEDNAVAGSYIYLFGKDDREYAVGFVNTTPTDGTACYIATTVGSTVYYLGKLNFWAQYDKTLAALITFEANEDGTYCLSEKDDINDKIVYRLLDSDQDMMVGTKDQSKWTLVEGNKLRDKDGYYLYLGYHSNGLRIWKGTKDQSKAASLIFSQDKTINNSGALNHTYIPLNAGDDDKVLDTNTGYLVGGTTYDSSREVPNVYGQGDVRVSGYNISYIQNATGSVQGYTAGNFEVLTRTVGSSGYVRVQDAYNGNSANNALSGYEKKSVDALGLTKYTEAREAMEGLLTNATNIYGLHFMAGSMKKSVEAEEVKIDRTQYSRYTMPESCIDFKLHSAGRINFFAGTYFSGSSNQQVTYFFALHHILRGENDSIVQQYQIDAVYQKNGDFYYKSGDNYYKNDEITETTLPEDAALTFDMMWLTAPGTLTQNAVYYFEIPVGAGEFALGCKNDGASNDIGAYLLYLDISANGQPVTARSVTKEYIEVNTQTAAYPRGVDFVSAGSVNKGGDASAAVALPAGGGEVRFSRDGNTITASSYTGSSAAYIADGVTLKQGDDPMTAASASSTSVVKLYTLTDTIGAGTNSSTRTIRIRYDEAADSFTYTLDDTELTWDKLSQAVSDLPTEAELQKEIKGYSKTENAQTVLEYTYSAAIGANVTWGSSFAWNAKKTGGAYAITLSADKALSVTVTKLADGYSATLNGNEVTKDKPITVDASTVQNAARRWPLKLSVKKPSISAREEPFDNERYPEGGAAVGIYPWSNMEDDELVAWLLERANWRTIRSVPIIDMNGEVLRSLYDRVESILNDELRMAALERLDKIFHGAYYIWEDMTDEEFMAWLLDEENAEWLVEILGDETIEAYQSLLQRIEDIEDEAQRLTAEARLEELRKLLAQHPWEKQTDEDFVYWLSDDTNLVTIKNILADEESEAYASLLARVSAIKDEALRAQAEARLALIRRLLPKKYDWDTQTDEDFVYWLRDDTNVSAVRAALDDPLAELSLRERIRAIVDAALRALAEARLEEIRASDGIYGTDKDTEIVQPGGGVYEVEDDTEVVQPPSPGGTYGIGSDTEVSPPTSGSSGLYRNGADTQLISAANAAETGSTPIAVFLPAWSAPAPVQMAALPSVDSIPRAGKGKYGR